MPLDSAKLQAPPAPVLERLADIESEVRKIQQVASDRFDFLRANLERLSNLLGVDVLDVPGVQSNRPALYD